MMKKITIKFLLISSFIFLMGFESIGQVSRSAYFLEHIPVSNALNPAFSPASRFYINLPLVSSFYFGVNSPLNYNDAFVKDEEADVIYIDRNEILNSLDDISVLSLDAHSELGRVGFRVKQHAFHLSVAKVLSADISLEKNLLKFLLFGNGSDDFLGKPVSFGETGINSSLYHEFGLGYSFDLDEKWTFGVKLKYLNGAVNIWTEKADLNIYTEDQTNYTITASTDISIHTANAYGDFDNMDFSDPMKFLWSDLFDNHGFGADFGVKFKPMNTLKLSASVIDIGKINWKENVKTYQSKYPGKEYVFEGFDISDLILDGTFSDSIAVLDSLSEHFSIDTISEPYSSMLTPKVYIGAAYHLTKNDQVGLLLKTKFVGNKLLPGATINYRRCFGDIFTAYVNYTFEQYGQNHVGLGFSFKAGPIMFYVLNDMFDAIFEPTRATGYNLQVGLSLVFGTPDMIVKPATRNKNPKM